MKLHVGSGKRRIAGYTNVDADASVMPDIVAKADSIPLGDGCADEILAVHLFEHLYRWQCDAVLKEWRRLLKPGGVLTMELPDLIKCCINLINGATGKTPGQMDMYGLYGDPTKENPWMCHNWGWSFNTIKPLLEKHGFTEVSESATQWHPIGKDHRDFRVTARKV